MEERQNDDDMPKLSIEQENEFKKMKLKLEHDAIFPDSSQMKLPPEIEGMFLDSIFNFEKAHKNAKEITVYEKLGKPKFKNESELSDKKLENALEKLEDLMAKNSIGLDVLADYDDEARLVYKFITEELFNHKILDVNVPGMNTCFIYEDFHPNHENDLERSTEDFLNMFFNKKEEFYEKFHYEEASNHLEINNFRSLFHKFKVKEFEINEIYINDETAKTVFFIEFFGRITGTNAKVTYSGDGNISFNFKQGFWYVDEVKLPIY